MKLIQTLENETHDENVEGLNNNHIHSDSGGESELSLNMEEEHRFDDSDEMDLDHRDECSESNHDLGSSLADWAIEFGISLMGLPALCHVRVKRGKLKKGKEDPNAVRTVGKDMGTNVRRALLKKLITKKKKQKQANIQQAK